MKAIHNSTLCSKLNSLRHSLLMLLYCGTRHKLSFQVRTGLDPRLDLPPPLLVLLSRDT